MIIHCTNSKIQVIVIIVGLSCYFFLCFGFDSNSFSLNAKMRKTKVPEFINEISEVHVTEISPVIVVILNLQDKDYHRT